MPGNKSDLRDDVVVLADVVALAAVVFEASAVQPDALFH